jgi:hypothetical protein
MTIMQVTINYLGLPLNVKEIDDILEESPEPHHTRWQLSVIQAFFGFPLKSLPREVLERYCEASSPDLYAPFMPHSSKLFERLISPLKSAKRSYCFGEYLATIELSAHVGEMLAQITWEMTPITHNKKRVTEVFEKGVLGSKFEKLGQERRISILHAFGAINDSQRKLFADLKNKRRGYFHLWSTGTENLKEDSLSSFKWALTLTCEILQIGISPNVPGKVRVNPNLVSYLKDRGDWSEST